MNWGIELILIFLSISEFIFKKFIMEDSIFRKDGTAQGVAKQRMIESLAQPDKRVIFDPIAEHFVLGASIIKIMGHKLSVWITKKFTPGFHEHLMARTRFVDDLVEKTVAEEAEQYVILGAGYDSRGHRLKLNSTIKIFEVDQNEVQNIKRSKLPANLTETEHITYVSIDFNTQSLSEQLIAAGFDKTKATIFTLEGVSQYITKDAIKSTLQEIGELRINSDTTFFMSYVDKRLKDAPKDCFGEGYRNAEKKAKTVQYLSAKVGEPWISLYSHEDIKELLDEFGFTLTENKCLKDLNSVYFEPLGRKLPENEIFNLEHFAVAVKKQS